MYEAYLQEPRVRGKHDEFFDMWGVGHDGELVLDLGCGRSQEYRHHGPGHWYFGFDANAEPETVVFDRKPMVRVERADYRSPEFIDRIKRIKGPEPEAFVSLFSSEITAPILENTALYERIFREVPTVQRALVAGFYYTRQRGANPVKEAGGIESWQTLDRIEHVGSHVYDELRMVATVPSSMFGEDVVEVWRILSRRR